MFLFLILVYSCNVLSKNCFTFHAEDYCKVWNNKAEDIKIIEYIRASESVNSWTKMITMKEYIHKKELNKILPTYIESI